MELGEEQKSKVENTSLPETGGEDFIAVEAQNAQVAAENLKEVQDEHARRDASLLARLRKNLKRNVTFGAVGVMVSGAVAAQEHVPTDATPTDDGKLHEIVITADGARKDLTDMENPTASLDGQGEMQFSDAEEPEGTLLSEWKAEERAKAEITQVKDALQDENAQVEVTPKRDPENLTKEELAEAFEVRQRLRKALDDVAEKAGIPRTSLIESLMSGQIIQQVVEQEWKGLAGGIVSDFAKNKIVGKVGNLAEDEFFDEVRDQQDRNLDEGRRTGDYSKYVEGETRKQLDYLESNLRQNFNYFGPEILGGRSISSPADLQYNIRYFAERLSDGRSFELSDVGNAAALLYWATDPKLSAEAGGENWSLRFDVDVADKKALLKFKAEF